MLREARIAEAVGGVVAVAGGGRADLLEARLEALAPGVRALMSFGVCGAADLKLRTGDWLVGAGVRGAAEYECDLMWMLVLGSRLNAFTPAYIWSDGKLADVASKRAVSATASAIDMESHVAGNVADRHGLPFAIARVVSDRADQTLPPAFANAIRPDGGTDLTAMLASIARHPAQLPRVFGASADAVRALASLRRLSHLLGPGLGFPDFA